MDAFCHGQGVYVTHKFTLKAPDPDVSVRGDGACEEVISLMRSSGWNPNGTGQVPWGGEEETPALFGSMHTWQGQVGCSKKTASGWEESFYQELK